ncbi:hypothetical protein KC953_00135, partial [Candidatus Saccharibacteria bacterium]|nr:hypothetical protein [Candidatus Saccharibacteria bacterium]
ATTGGTPTIAAIGDDTNKNLNITTKGTGTVKINNVDTATISDTQTLTNKTLVSPKIGTSILDTSGNILLSLAPYASAVNYLRLANRGTGLNPYLLVDGADSNIDLQINPKGSGGLMFYVTTGQTPTIKADGADANHNLNLVPKGTGTVKANGVDVVTVSGTQTLTNKTLTAPKIDSIKDANGNTQLHFTNVASAANYLTIANSAAGSLPSLQSTMSMRFINASAGYWEWRNDNGVAFMVKADTAATVNYLRITGSTSGNNVELIVSGSDPADAGIQLRTRGSGQVLVNNVPVVTTTDTQSLSNKTLVSPIVYSGAGSANLSTASDAADANLNIYSKGNSYVVLNNGYGVAFKANALTSSVNFLQATATATGSAPVLYATGTDTNIGINLYPKGSGTVNVNGVDVVTVSGTQTLTNKTLTNPIMNQIMDTVNNGVVAVFTGSGASPTAFHRFYNAVGAGTATVLLTAEGSATNINQRFYLKGTGQFQIYIPTGQTTATVSGIGADGNTNLNLTSQGTGVVQANGNTVLSGVAVPATATSTGKQHQVACDGSYIYYCIADNTWVRAAVGSW